MSVASLPIGLISQFKCTSSLILLTHPEFVNKVKGTFMIDRIYDKEKNKLWTSGDEQNISTIPMQTLYIILQQPRDIGIIVKFCRSYNKGASILDVVAVAEADKIPDEVSTPPTDFPDDLSTLAWNRVYCS